MNRLTPRHIRNLLGGVAVSVFVFELLSLWSFITAYFTANGSVLFAFPFVTFSIPPLVLLALFGLGVFAAVRYSGREDIPGTLEAGIRRAGELAGLLDPRDVIITAAIEYNHVRWQASVTEDRTVRDLQRQCRHCRRDLTAAHLPASKLRNTPTESDDAGSERPASLVSTVVHTVADTDRVDADIVEARACPNCDYAIADSHGETGNRAEVESTLLHHAKSLTGADGNPTETLVEAAATRLGRDPGPADIWDEYVLHTDEPELVFVTVDEDSSDVTATAVETYPAFESLRDRASGMDTALEYLVPESMKPLLSRQVHSTYLVERQALREERETVRNELIRGLGDLGKQVGDDIHAAQKAADSRTRPKHPRTLENAVKHARAELEQLNRDLDENFLTYGEQHRLSRLRRRLARTEAYLATTRQFRRDRTAIEAEIDEFDDAYDPYREFARYMPTRDQRALRKHAHDIRTSLHDLQTETQFSNVPVEAEEWLRDAHETFVDHCTRLPAYNDGTADLKGFVDREIDRYGDLLTSEHGELNPEQKRAVVRNDLHNIVDASAGTGKTLTLTKRVEYLQATGVDIDDILVLTLTRPSRQKLEDDILATVDGVHRPWDLNVYNFHGFASEIISDARGAGLRGWDREETKTAFANGFCDAEPHYTETYPDAYRQFEDHATEYTTITDDDIEPDDIVDFVTTARNFAVTATDVVAELSEAQKRQYHFGMAAAAVLDALRQQSHEEYRPVDELDKLETATRIIRDHPDAFADRYEHVLVDEFQDVAGPSVDLIKALLDASERRTRLFVVGDAWQSIYGFRGSNPGFFTEFEQRFDSVSRTVLETNYRCPKPVVDGSRALMADNYHTPKPAAPHESNPDVPPKLYQIEGFYRPQSTELVQRIIDVRVADGELNPEDVLILTRNVSYNPIVSEVEAALREDGYTITDENDADGITLQTIHSSKGEDAECVILLHAVDGGYHGLPSEERTKELTDPANQPSVSHLKEQRRLCYVALTRSAGELHVVTKAGQESPFIRDIEGYFEAIAVDGRTTLTGRITEIDLEEKRCTGVLDCEELGEPVEFAVLQWQHDDDAYTRLVENIEPGRRYQFTEVQDTSGSKYEDVEITSDSTVTPLGSPEPHEATD